jgi:hypothetical protein
MIYGWIGSVAFLSMILLTGYRLATTALRHRKRKSYLVVLTAALAIFWFVFLADQYKISILRNPAYQMMFWIWLGLSNALLKTIHYSLPTKKAAPRLVAEIHAEDDSA